MFAGYDNKMAKEDSSWHVAANTGDKKQEIYQNPVRISEERILVGPRSVIVLEADQQ